MSDVAKKLNDVIRADVYPASVSAAGSATYFLARRGREKFVGCMGSPCLPSVQKAGELDGQCVCTGPLNAENAAALRKALPWTAPRPLGMATSAGFGDRLGLATPGHLRAIQGTGIKPILAQQSIREMTRTQRTAQAVMDAATWGVFQVGYKDGFGSDADHIQATEGLDMTMSAGFTTFTIDPGQHVIDAADTMSAADLQANLAKIDLKTLERSMEELKKAYVTAKPLPFAGAAAMDDAALLRAVVKYGNAIAHTARMYRYLKANCKQAFELEVSVDETSSPTTPEEHYFIAAELKRLGVQWVSLAPRFVGRFEKGVDYIGDLGEFRACFAAHVNVMKAVGPYKMSIHSGSDKFSIYPIIADLAGPMVHLKTAGTSWLEAVRAVAHIDPGLFREMLDFARQRYETDKASYHVSADIAKVPAGKTLSDKQLIDLMDEFNAREVLHVTFGSILTADNGERFRKRLYAAIESSEETYYAVLQKHLGRHVAPFAGKAK